VVLYLSESIIYAGGVVPELADWSSAEDWHNFTQRQFAEWPSTTPAPAREHRGGQSSVAETIEGLYDGEEPKLAYCAFEASSHSIASLPSHRFLYGLVVVAIAAAARVPAVCDYSIPILIIDIIIMSCALAWIA
jgi:hypothetical protein